MRTSLLLFLLACGGPDPGSPPRPTVETDVADSGLPDTADRTGTDSDAVADSGLGGPTDTDTDVAWGALHGTRPADALPAPDALRIRNQDGEERDVTDLVGTPTVMWFFPRAATST